MISRRITKTERLNPKASTIKAPLNAPSFSLILSVECLRRGLRHREASATLRSYHKSINPPSWARNILRDKSNLKLKTRKNKIYLNKSNNPRLIQYRHFSAQPIRHKNWKSVPLRLWNHNGRFVSSQSRWYFSESNNP